MPWWILQPPKYTFTVEAVITSPPVTCFTRVAEFLILDCATNKFHILNNNNNNNNDLLSTVSHHKNLQSKINIISVTKGTERSLSLSSNHNGLKVPFLTNTKLYNQIL